MKRTDFRQPPRHHETRKPNLHKRDGLLLKNFPSNREKYKSDSKSGRGHFHRLDCVCSEGSLDSCTSSEGSVDIFKPGHSKPLLLRSAKGGRNFQPQTISSNSQKNHPSVTYTAGALPKLTDTLYDAMDVPLKIQSDCVSSSSDSEPLTSYKGSLDNKLENNDMTPEVANDMLKSPHQSMLLSCDLAHLKESGSCEDPNVIPCEASSIQESSMSHDFPSLSCDIQEPCDLPSLSHDLPSLSHDLPSLSHDLPSLTHDQEEPLSASSGPHDLQSSLSPQAASKVTSGESLKVFESVISLGIPSLQEYRKTSPKGRGRGRGRGRGSILQLFEKGESLEEAASAVESHHSSIQLSSVIPFTENSVGRRSSSPVGSHSSSHPLPVTPVPVRRGTSLVRAHHLVQPSSTSSVILDDVNSAESQSPFIQHVEPSSVTPPAISKTFKSSVTSSGVDIQSPPPVGDHPSGKLPGSEFQLLSQSTPKDTSLAPESSQFPETRNEDSPTLLQNFKPNAIGNAIGRGKLLESLLSITPTSKLGSPSLSIHDPTTPGHTSKLGSPSSAIHDPMTPGHTSKLGSPSLSIHDPTTPGHTSKLGSPSLSIHDPTTPGHTSKLGSPSPSIHDPMTPGHTSKLGSPSPSIHDPMTPGHTSNLGSPSLSIHDPTTPGHTSKLGLPSPSIHDPMTPGHTSNLGSPSLSIHDSTTPGHTSKLGSPSPSIHDPMTPGHTSKLGSPSLSVHDSTTPGHTSKLGSPSSSIHDSTTLDHKTPRRMPSSHQRSRILSSNTSPSPAVKRQGRSSKHISIAAVFPSQSPPVTTVSPTAVAGTSSDATALQTTPTTLSICTSTASPAKVVQFGSAVTEATALQTSPTVTGAATKIIQRSSGARLTYTSTISPTKTIQFSSDAIGAAALQTTPTALQTTPTAALQTTPTAALQTTPSVQSTYATIPPTNTAQFSSDIIGVTALQTTATVISNQSHPVVPPLLAQSHPDHSFTQYHPDDSLSFTKFEGSSPPPLAEATPVDSSPVFQLNPEHVSYATKGAAAYSSSASSSNDELGAKVKPQGGRTKDEVEQRIAALQRSIHCRQVELKKTEHKNETMAREFDAEIKEIESDNIKSDNLGPGHYVPPERIRAFDRLLRLSAKAVVATETIKESEKIRRDFKMRSYDKLGSDKLAKMELELVLTEDDIKEKVAAAKAKTDLLRGKLDFYINDLVS